MMHDIVGVPMSVKMIDHPHHVIHACDERHNTHRTSQTRWVGCVVVCNIGIAGMPAERGTVTTNHNSGILGHR